MSDKQTENGVSILHKRYVKDDPAKKAVAEERVRTAMQDMGLDLGIAYPRLDADLNRMSAEVLTDLANMIRALRL